MLETRVLILNRLFQPVNVTNVRRALGMLYIGTARALYENSQLFDFASWARLSANNGEETIRTLRRRILVPRVLVLQAYDRVPRTTLRLSRTNIFMRDDHTCQYCGSRPLRRELNLDHVLPRSRGGLTTWENLVASCMRCNLKKGGRTPAEAGMRLQRQPRQPRWSELVQRPRLRPRYNAWIPFLQSAPTCTCWKGAFERD